MNRKPLLGLLAVGIGTLALTGCGQSAIEYIFEQDNVAIAELEEKHKTAQLSSDAAVESYEAQVREVTNAFSAALEEGDGDALLSVAHSDLVGAIQSSETLAAWQGTGEVSIVSDDSAFAPILEPAVLDDALEGVPEDMPRKEVFGDRDYVPTVGGVPYQDYEFPQFTAPESTQVLWRIDGGEDRCLGLIAQDDGYVADNSCPGLLERPAQPTSTNFFGKDDSKQLMMVGDRRLSDLTHGQSPSPELLVGRYDVTLDPSLGDLVSISAGEEGVNLSDVVPELAASPPLLEQAQKHVNDWLAAQVALAEDDDRCGLGSARDTLQVNDVATPILWVCAWGYDASQDSLDFAKLDEKHTVTIEQGDYDTHIRLEFTANGDGPVAQIKRYQPEGFNKGHSAFPISTISVRFQVDDGSANYSAEDSIIAR